MAAEPYNPVPTVAPAENAPNDTLRVNPTPASFGGLVAQGGQQLGAGAQRAGQFFGQVAADQASNNFQQQASDIVTNYKSLRGQQALDARPQVEKQLDDLLNSTRSTLTTPQQNLQFDDFSRRYRTYLNADIGTHYDQQQQVWMKGVHDQTIKVNLNSIAADPENADHVANAAKSVVDGFVNNARLEGTPEDAGVLSGKQAAAVAQVEAIGAKHPNKALRMIDNYRDILGVQYAPLRERISARADQELGIQKAGQYGTQSATELASQPIEQRSVPPLFTQATEASSGGFSPKGLATTIHIESGGDPNATHGSMRGLGQFSPATWARYGQGSPYDPEQALLATQRYAAANAQYLAQALGRKPTDGELYLAHQQGPAGAASLIANPQMPAAQALLQSGAYHTLHAAQNAIVSNGGDPNAPAANFVAKWTARFGGPGGAVIPFGGATAEIPTAAATVAPPVPASDLPVTPAAFTSAPGVIPPPLPPPPSPAPIATPADTYALQVQRIQEDPELQARPRARAAAMEQARATFTAAQLASEADARAQKERSDQATLGYTDTISKLAAGQLPPDQRAALVPSIYANHALTLEAKNALASAVTRAGGGADEASYGPAYVQALAGLTAPYGSPDRISGPDQIVQLYASGAITSKGRDDLMRMYGEVKRDPETAGVAQSKSAFLASYKAKMVYDATPLYPGQVIRPDKEGEEAFDAKFLPAANSMYDKYVAGGGNPYDFMLDPKNVKRLDDLANSIRPKKAVDAAYVSATGDPADVTPSPSAPSMSQAARGAELGTEAGRTIGGIAVPHEAPPPAPPDVDAAGWSTVMQTRPVTDKGAWKYADWAKAVQYLQAHPDTADTFDKHFPNAPTNAAAILSALRPKTRAPYGAPPPPPEPAIVSGL